MTSSIHGEQLVNAGLLLAMSAIYGEACDRSERLSRYLTADGVLMNQNSVVCFAGVLVLPPQLAAVLVLAVYLHSFIRARRARVALPHRLAFTAGSTVLATVAAGELFSLLSGSLDQVSFGGALAVLLTLGVYTSINLVLLLICLRLVTKAPSWRVLLPSRDQVMYENSTLLLGVFTAVLVVHAIWLSPLILVLVASLHRASLVNDLQESARTDAKTGLLNSGGWQVLARQQLAQCAGSGTPAAVLLIDLDHFKRVNDTHGHLAGDVVLKAISDILVRELRGYDAVGRYGGEEFIALLPGVESQAALAIGERVRSRISGGTPDSLGLVTASIGVSIGQASSGLDLEEMIGAADTALYRAKSAGRDQVILAEAADPVSVDPDERRVAAPATDSGTPDTEALAPPRLAPEPSRWRPRDTSIDQSEREPA